METDNRIASMKAAIDAIAGVLIPGLPPGIADSDKRLQWEITQKKGQVREYALEIKISQKIPMEMNSEFGNAKSELLKRLWPQSFNYKE